MRLPRTTGADRPPYGARHRKFSPLIAHFSGKPVSADVPSPFGPPCPGQSPRATRRGPCAHTETQRHKTTAARSHEFFSIITSSRSPAVEHHNRVAGDIIRKVPKIVEEA